jgi:hypothetical protein
MRDPVQTADHGAKGIDTAQAVFIERTHQINLLTFGCKPIAFCNVSVSQQPDLILFFSTQSLKVSDQIEIFRHSIMKKMVSATTAGTIFTKGTIVIGCLPVCLIHGLIKDLELFHKGIKPRIIWSWQRVHGHLAQSLL